MRPAVCPLVLLLLCMFAAPAHPQPTDRYVDSAAPVGGVSSQCSTRVLPCQTITTAVANAVAGDTVVVVESSGFPYDMTALVSVAIRMGFASEDYATNPVPGSPSRENVTCPWVGSSHIGGWTLDAQTFFKGVNLLDCPVQFNHNASMVDSTWTLGEEASLNVTVPDISFEDATIIVEGRGSFNVHRNGRVTTTRTGTSLKDEASWTMEGFSTLNDDGNGLTAIDNSEVTLKNYALAVFDGGVFSLAGNASYQGNPDYTGPDETAPGAPDSAPPGYSAYASPLDYSPPPDSASPQANEPASPSAYSAPPPQYDPYWWSSGYSSTTEYNSGWSGYSSTGSYYSYAYSTTSPPTTSSSSSSTAAYSSPSSSSPSSSSFPSSSSSPSTTSSSPTSFGPTTTSGSPTTTTSGSPTSSTSASSTGTSTTTYTTTTTTSGSYYDYGNYGYGSYYEAPFDYAAPEGYSNQYGSNVTGYDSRLRIKNDGEFRADEDATVRLDARARIDAESGSKIALGGDSKTKLTSNGVMYCDDCAFTMNERSQLKVDNYGEVVMATRKSTFTASDSSVVTLNYLGSLTARFGSKMTFEGNSTVFAHELCYINSFQNGQIVVKDNALLDIANQGWVEVHGGGTVSVEGLAKVSITNNGRIRLHESGHINLRNQSRLELSREGYLVIEDNGDLIASGNSTISLRRESFILYSNGGRLNLTDTSSLLMSGKSKLYSIADSGTGTATVGTVSIGGNATALFDDRAQIVAFDGGRTIFSGHSESYFTAKSKIDLKAKSVVKLKDNAFLSLSGEAKIVFSASGSFAIVDKAKLELDDDAQVKLNGADKGRGFVEVKDDGVVILGGNSQLAVYDGNAMSLNERAKFYILDSAVAGLEGGNLYVQARSLLSLSSNGRFKVAAKGKVNVKGVSRVVLAGESFFDVDGTVTTTNEAEIRLTASSSFHVEGVVSAKEKAKIRVGDNATLTISGDVTMIQDCRVITGGTSNLTIRDGGNLYLGGNANYRSWSGSKLSVLDGGDVFVNGKAEMRLSDTSAIFSELGDAYFGGESQLTIEDEAEWRFLQGAKFIAKDEVLITGMERGIVLLSDTGSTDPSVPESLVSLKDHARITLDGNFTFAVLARGDLKLEDRAQLRMGGKSTVIVGARDVHQYASGSVLVQNQAAVFMNVSATTHVNGGTMVVEHTATLHLSGSGARLHVQSGGNSGETGDVHVRDDAAVTLKDGAGLLIEGGGDLELSDQSVTSLDNAFVKVVGGDVLLENNARLDMTGPASILNVSAAGSSAGNVRVTNDVVVSITTNAQVLIGGGGDLRLRNQTVTTLQHSPMHIRGGNAALENSAALHLSGSGALLLVTTDGSDGNTGNVLATDASAVTLDNEAEMLIEGGGDLKLRDQSVTTLTDGSATVSGGNLDLDNTAALHLSGSGALLMVRSDGSDGNTGDVRSGGNAVINVEDRAEMSIRGGGDMSLSDQSVTTISDALVSIIGGDVRAKDTAALNFNNEADMSIRGGGDLDLSGQSVTTLTGASATVSGGSMRIENTARFLMSGSNAILNVTAAGQNGDVHVGDSAVVAISSNAEVLIAGGGDLGLSDDSDTTLIDSTLHVCGGSVTLDHSADLHLTGSAAHFLVKTDGSDGNTGNVHARNDSVILIDSEAEMSIRGGGDMSLSDQSVTTISDASVSIIGGDVRAKDTASLNLSGSGAIFLVKTDGSDGNTGNVHVGGTARLNVDNEAKMSIKGGGDLSLTDNSVAAITGASVGVAGGSLKLNGDSSFLVTGPSAVLNVTADDDDDSNDAGNVRADGSSRVEISEQALVLIGGGGNLRLGNMSEAALTDASVVVSGGNVLVDNHATISLSGSDARLSVKADGHNEGSAHITSSAVVSLDHKAEAKVEGGGNLTFSGQSVTRLTGASAHVSGGRMTIEHRAEVHLTGSAARLVVKTDGSDGNSGDVVVRHNAVLTLDNEAHMAVKGGGDLELLGDTVTTVTDATVSVTGGSMSVEDDAELHLTGSSARFLAEADSDADDDSTGDVVVGGAAVIKLEHEAGLALQGGGDLNLASKSKLIVDDGSVSVKGGGMTMRGDAHFQLSGSVATLNVQSGHGGSGDVHVTEDAVVEVGDRALVSIGGGGDLRLSATSVTTLNGASTLIISSGDLKVLDEAELYVNDKSLIDVVSGAVVFSPSATIRLRRGGKIQNDGKIQGGGKFQVPSGSSIEVGAGGNVVLDSKTEIEGDDEHTRRERAEGDSEGRVDVNGGRFSFESEDSMTVGVDFQNNDGSVNFSEDHKGKRRGRARFGRRFRQRGGRSNTNMEGGEIDFDGGLELEGGTLSGRAHTTLNGAVNVGKDAAMHHTRLTVNGRYTHRGTWEADVAGEDGDDENSLFDVKGVVEIEGGVIVINLPNKKFKKGTKVNIMNYEKLTGEFDSVIVTFGDLGKGKRRMARDVMGGSGSDDVTVSYGTSSMSVLFSGGEGNDGGGGSVGDSGLTLIQLLSIIFGCVALIMVIVVCITYDIYRRRRRKNASSALQKQLTQASRSENSRATSSVPSAQVEMTSLPDPEMYPELADPMAK